MNSPCRAANLVFVLICSVPLIGLSAGLESYSLKEVRRTKDQAGHSDVAGAGRAACAHLADDWARAFEQAEKQVQHNEVESEEGYEVENDYES